MRLYPNSATYGELNRLISSNGVDETAMIRKFDAGVAPTTNLWLIRRGRRRGPAHEYAGR